jgi:replicative DNA helicase
MPGFKRAQLPPGPLRDLVDALHQLHLLAGYPSARQLQREIGGAGVASHTAVHNLFTGTSLPNWGLIELLVEVLARQARLNEKAEVERFRQLWGHAARPGSVAKESDAMILELLGANGPSQKEEPERFSRPIADLLSGVLEEIEAVGTRSAVGSFRIPTGLNDLDALLGGWSQGCLIVIGGLPSSGKTTLLLTFCRAASVKYRLPSMLISGEMNDRELQSRLLSAEARVPLHHLRTGLMSEQDWTRLARVLAAMADAPIRVGAPTDFRIEQLGDDVHALSQGSGLKLLLIDSLQWITGHANSARASTESSLWSLKKLAEAAKIPVIITAQAERNRDGLPAVSPIRQLADDDAIERVADVLIMLHRLDQDEPEHPRAGEADLIVTKNRNGPTATVAVACQYHYCRFTDMIPGDDTLFPTDPGDSDTYGDVPPESQRQRIGTRDQQRFRRFIDQLAPDGRVIEWLKLNFLMKTHPLGLFSELEQLIRSRELNPIRFDDEEVGNSYERLGAAIEQFCSKVSWWTWLDKEQHWLSIPLDWRDDAPERWEKATSEILRGRNGVIEAYDEFLSVCRKNNVDPN